MGFSESQRVCKDHPDHDQKLGVCAACLRDKLSQLYVDVPSSLTKSASMAESPYSSSSTHMSPVNRHQRNGSDVLMGSMSFRISLRSIGLKKSKSIAFVPTPSNNKNNKKKKKKGFWSKILHSNKDNISSKF